VGKTGFARAARTFDPPQKAYVFLGTPGDFMRFRGYEEPHKSGKLAENRRFFAKLKDVLLFCVLSYGASGIILSSGAPDA